MNTVLTRSRLTGTLCLLLLAAGCASVPERNPVPASLADTAEVPGMPGIRYWADDAPPYAKAWLELSPEDLLSRYPASFGNPHNYLAISGGGANGAFGAGLLNGWTASGSRPEFTVVTGISTGALIAPFAFLGPDYDHVLRKVYTEFSTKDLLEPRGLVETLTGEAATDSAPLRARIGEFVTEEVVAAIAAEHKRGRSLLITTTNLDAGRSVTWQIGRIAESGSPDALNLIRDVMLASASIPAALPPVLVEVEAEGQIYDELHVDGNTGSVVNLYPLALDWRAVLERLEIEEAPNLYIIRNGHAVIPHEIVDRRTIHIAGRSIQTLMNYLALGDLYELYLATKRDGVHYYLADIPADFLQTPTEPFDREYMNALFELAYRAAADGYPWQRLPPNYHESDTGTLREM
jgi:hypothetical protein